jgi:hypothetical protein
MSEAVTLPRALRDFVDTAEWTFAKTMPEWPHEYLVRDRVDKSLFEALVRHIRAHGFEGQFYHKVLTYYAEDGLLYWSMGAPIEETTIINRCKEEGSYENRLLKGTLPESKSIAAEPASTGDEVP